MKGIPAMSPPEVHNYIRDLGRAWTGQGCAMEVGCWLGATSAALLEGLVEAGYDKPFWAFDRWVANESEVRKAKDQKVKLKLKQDLMPVYAKNTLARYDNVKMVKGNIPRSLKTYPAGPIEICLFDAPKRNPAFMGATAHVIRHFIPGVTVFGLLDYYFYVSRKRQRKGDWKKFLAPVNFIENHPENFTMLREFPNDGSCVFFRYEKPISWNGQKVKK